MIIVKQIVFIVLISQILAFDCPAKSKKEQVFMSQNETKIFNLDKVFADLNEKIISTNETNWNEDIGRLTRNQLILLEKQQVQITKEFSQIIDQSIFQEKGGKPLIQFFLGFSPSQYFVQLGNYNEGEYWLKIFKLPRFVNKQFIEIFKKQESKEFPSLKQELEVFDSYSPYDEQTTITCFGVSFLSETKIVVDCTIMTTPMVYENVFVFLNLEEIIYREYINNVNIGQYNQIVRRKIGIVNHSQKENDPDDKTLIRAHLEVDEDHTNYTYVEVFSIDVDEDSNSMVVLVEVIDEKYINSFENMHQVEMNVLNFALTDYDLVLLLNYSIVIFPFINNSTIPKSVLINKADSDKIYAFEENNDEVQTVWPFKTDIAFLHENSRFANFHKVTENSETPLNSLIILDEYIIAMSDNEASIIKMNDFSIHSKIVNNQDFKGLFDDSCTTLGTGIRNQFLISCKDRVEKGDIQVEQLILQPSQISTEPIKIQVLGEDQTKKEIHCQIEIVIEVGSPNSEKLEQVDEYQVDLSSLSSRDVYKSNELTYIMYEELVEGPDVTLISATVNGSPEFLTDINYREYNLKDLNITLNNNDELLGVVRSDQNAIVAFYVQKNQIFATNCILLMKNDITINYLKCSNDATPIKVNGVLGNFQAHFIQQSNQIIFGFTSADFLYLYSFKQGVKKAITMEPNLEKNGTYNFQFNNETMIIYQSRMSDIRIYSLKYNSITQQSIYDLRTTMIQQQILTIFNIPFYYNSYFIVSRLIGVLHQQENRFLFHRPLELYFLKRTKIDGNYRIIQFIQYFFIQQLLQLYPEVYTCAHRWGQLFLQHQNVSIFGTDPLLFFRGDYGSFQASFTSNIASRDAIYLQSLDKIYQYSAFQDESLVTALQRIINVEASKVLAVSLGSINFYNNGQDCDLLYVKTSDQHLVYVLATQKKLLLNLTSLNSNNYFSVIKLEFNFKNSFNSQISIKSSQPVVTGEPQLIAIEDAKTPKLKSKLPDHSNLPEVFFDIEDLFQGPISNIIIDNPNYSFINKVHFVKSVRNDDLVDFVHFFDANVSRAMVLTTNQVRLTKSDLTNKLQDYQLNLDPSQICKHIWYDQPSFLVECGTTSPKVIFTADLSKQKIEALVFERIDLNSTNELTKVIKSKFIKSNYYILQKNIDKTALYIYHVDTNTSDQYMLGNGDYTDFEIYDSQHVLLLEQSAGIEILKVSDKRRILQDNTISIKDSLNKAGQLLFTDSKFNGIKVSNRKVFITTNNALTYQLDLNLKSNSIDFVQSYIRLSDLPLNPQSIWVADDCLILGYNNQQLGSSLSFYNISNPNYFQVLENKQLIAGQPIKLIENNYNNNNGAEFNRSQVELEQWPLRGGFVMKSADGKMIQLGQIAPRVAIEIMSENHNDSQEIVVITANNQNEKKNLLLEIDVHWTNGEEATQELEEEGYQQKQAKYFIQIRFNQIMQNPIIAAVIYGFVVFSFVLILAFVYRQCRRNCLKNENIHEDEPQEFNDIP